MKFCTQPSPGAERHAADQGLAPRLIGEHRREQGVGGLFVLLHAELGDEGARRADVVEEIRVGVGLERQAGAGRGRAGARWRYGTAWR